MIQRLQSRRSFALALVALAFLALQPRDAEAVTYNPADSTMAHLELVGTPTLLGPTDDHPGMYEYVYDFYHAVGTWEKYININGFEVDQIANLHDIGSGLGLYQTWDTHSSGGWPLWGGFWNKAVRPSYYSGGFPLWELPSEGACVGCPNEAYEYINEWHTPFDYSPSVFHGDGKGVLGDVNPGIPGNDNVYFGTWNPGGPNQYGVGGLGLTVRIVHPNAPGTITWDTYHWNGQQIIGTVVGPSLSPPPPACIIGDADCDGYVDIGGDILPAFTNFTGPGSFGKTRIQGDVHGPSVATVDQDPHDGDVDVQDLLTMFGAFTGPAPDGSGGLAAAEALDPNIPDLIYNAATGEVTLDVDGAGIIGYVLKNGSSDFAFGSHLQILAGVKTSVLNELSEAAFASSVGANSIGNVFPTGMNLAALSAYLTVNQVSTSLGAPVVPFDLVVLSTGPAVPEPATVLLSVFGLIGMAMVARRRRRTA